MKKPEDVTPWEILFEWTAVPFLTAWAWFRLKCAQLRLRYLRSRLQRMDRKMENEMAESPKGPSSSDER